MALPPVYPPSHEEALERVLLVVDLLAARPGLTDDEVVSALVGVGISELDSELLLGFVPTAFAFALLRLMGVKNFPSTYGVQNGAGQWVELPLAAEHYFTAALEVGDDVTVRGYTRRINKAAFTAVVMRSAEIAAVNRYFAAGGTREGLAGSTLSPLMFIRITAEQIGASR